MKARYIKNDGTFYDVELEKTEFKCPNCGLPEIFGETGEGDYYVGVDYYCKSCSFKFNMPYNEVDEGVVFIE